MKLEIYNLADRDDYVYSVIITKDKNGLVLVQHKDRSSWEIPAGHIERGESPLEAAHRELKEETGAREYTLYEVCDYSVSRSHSKVYGRLFYAEILSYSGKLEHEIEKVRSFHSLPPELTYPDIQPVLLKEVLLRVESGSVL